ncbi:MaoC family dehydratase [Cytophagaceae bacterium DM2B3-1]|uniref:MaoC family dehydratase n=1 Tax=Xanthocytophaga flava TaxID=3048013 RepID=A0AAE3QMJ1_9BACT|nr:MaoC family dehydratase [Xanthocytophaga flavus]MDJ1480170.1 MaoC family dehydratase [Xanthocytophaga flavus]MDJ1495594.1 MaoC family dehydratase [Xanthocytophaga flavus]
MLEVNQIYTHDFSFSQKDVEAFATVTGDTNPLHLDAEFAAKTIFRKPIIHGFLGGSVFSKVLGTQFPGEGSIYLKQSMEFVQPMVVGVTYQAVFTVLEILPKSSARIETKIIEVETQKVVTTGEAVVMNRQLIPKI